MAAETSANTSPLPLASESLIAGSAQVSQVAQAGLEAARSQVLEGDKVGAILRIVLSAGEASGDAYGAVLAREIYRLAPQFGFDEKEIDLTGIGGPAMKAAGVRIVADSSNWGAISIVESLRTYPKVVRGYYSQKGKLRNSIPGIFIPIDFGYANIRLARTAKQAGWKVVYLIPPGSWRRDRQGKDLPQITDHIVTPFPWSAEMLNKLGAEAHFFGHPIKQLNREVDTSGPRHGVALLPGSRRAEVEQLMPLYSRIMVDRPDVPAVFPVSGTVERQVAERWERLPQRENDVFVQPRTRGGMASVAATVQAAIACSGTATLEVALAKTPMAIVYRVSKAVETEAKLIRFKMPKFIGLPNVLLDREIAPEFVQHDATPEKVGEYLDRLLSDDAERTRQLEGFEELSELLGPSDALTRTAELVLTLARRSTSPGVNWD